jgi:hypothetical protein
MPAEHSLRRSQDALSGWRKFARCNSLVILMSDLPQSNVPNYFYLLGASGFGCDLVATWHASLLSAEHARRASASGHISLTWDIVHVAAKTAAQQTCFTNGTLHNKKRRSRLILWMWRDLQLRAPPPTRATTPAHRSPHCPAAPTPTHRSNRALPARYKSSSWPGRRDLTVATCIE